MRKLLPFISLLLLSTTVFAHGENEQSFCRFIPNKGQFAEPVKFKGKINHGNLFLEENAFTFNFMDNSALARIHLGEKLSEKEMEMHGHAYKVIFQQAQTKKLSEALPTEEYYNFFRGNDKNKWASGLYAYREITYHELYPGIDLKVYTHDEHLKYDFILQAGANPSVIRQEYQGLENLQLTDGNLIIKTKVMTVTEMAPTAWQIINGKKVNVEVRFKLENKILTYEFPNGYNSQYELVIDPVLIFGSSSGSYADNFGMTATYSSQGHLFTGGTAFDVGYPVTPGAYMTTPNVNGTTNGITDVVITKYAPNGTSLAYSTYIGGGNGSQGAETVHSLICNANDELFLMGVTSSTDFPTTPGAYDTTHDGGTYVYFPQNGTLFSTGTDIYVSKFDVSGTTLLGSTFIGGNMNDGINSNNNTSLYDSLQKNYGDQFRGEVMMDQDGNCYIASVTKSPNFPTVNAIQSAMNGDQDAVVFKFDPTLSTLIWSTYLGGSKKDAAYSLKVDENYITYVCGGTSSTDFPTTAGTLHTTYQGGKTDGFIVEIAPNGSSLLASTYLGTTSYDQTYFLDIDRYFDVYVVGQTEGTATYPVVNVSYSNPNSGQFITKLDHDLTTIEYSTVFGNGNGQINISPAAFMVDVCGNVYVSGWGYNILVPNNPLTGMPTTSNAFQTSSGDGYNFYLIVFSRNIGSLLYATYFGGSLSQEHVDGGTSRFSQDGIVYQSVCAGCWGNDDFPTTPGAWSEVNNSSFCNNGVFKFDFEIEPDAAFIISDTAGCAPLTLTFDNTSPVYTDYFWDFGNNDTTSTDPNPTRTFPTPGNYTVYLIVEDSVCGLLMDTAMQIITVYPALELITSDTTMCTPGNFTLVADANGTSPNFYWSTNGNISDTLNSPITDSTLFVSITGDTTFYVSVGNGFCTYIDTVNISIPIPDILLNAPSGICAGDTITLSATNQNGYPISSYDFGPDSLIIFENGSSFATASTDYDNWFWVIATSTAGCTDGDSAFVTVQGPPSGLIEATADQYTIGTGSSTVLHATPSGYTYSWTPASSLDNPNSQNPVASPSVTTTYTVLISNSGCTRSDTVTIVVVDALCEEPYIYVPNAFTPNNDGENDKLYVRGLYIETLLFRVYDRWGEKVWETTDQTLGWDGTFQGRDCDPAVFDYYIQVACPGGDEYFKKGNITLIR